MKNNRTFVNEPAFPNEGFNGWGEPFQGMDLRDYFAAKAMQGFLDQLINIKQGWHSDDLETVAETSYRMADAMMKARGQE
jgi:hypothetical protein